MLWSMSAFWNGSGREAEMRPNQQGDQDSYTHLGNLFTYLDANDRQRGPCSLSQLFSWCAYGQLPPATKVRQQNWPSETFRALSHMPGFSRWVSGTPAGVRHGQEIRYTSAQRQPQQLTPPQQVLLLPPPQAQPPPPPHLLPDPWAAGTTRAAAQALVLTLT